MNWFKTLNFESRVFKSITLGMLLMLAIPSISKANSSNDTPDEDAGSFSATVTASGSPFAASQTIQIVYRRVGNIVSLFLPAINTAANGVASPIITFPAGTVPVNLRPGLGFAGSSGVYQEVAGPNILSNSANTGLGVSRIYTSGDIDIILAAGGNWATTGNNGFDGFTISYLR